MLLSPGSQVANYRVERLIGRGGSAEVYAATRLTDGLRVALKRMPRLQGFDRDRAHREIAIARALEHPRIVRVLDHGATDDDGLFLAMELLTGETLAATIAPTSLTPERAVATLRQVAEGVAWAHAKGVVHRDLKPANMFLVASIGGSLDARVLDFGLSAGVDSTSLTRPGDVLGTPAYMAPEQVRGDRSRDPRVDVYALGVTLYECLSGSLPFKADSVASLMFQVAFNAPIPLDRVAPRVPSALVALVHECLSKDPAARPRDAAALIERFDALGPLEAAERPSTLPDDEHEQRLVLALCVRSPRTPGLVRELLDDAGAERFELPHGSLGLFGRLRWEPSIPADALALARDVALTASAVSLVCAKVARGDALPQFIVDAAVATLPARGIGVDASVASLLRPHCAVSVSPDGRRTVALRDPTTPRAASTPTVGRTRDVEWLIEAIASATSTSQPICGLVHGPSGIGLSRLCDEALREARNRWPSLHALRVRCDASTAEVPFAGLRALLGEYLNPRVVGALQTPNRSGDPQASMDRARAHVEGIFQSLAEDAPVVLAIDDAQWLDATSRALFRSLFEGAPPFALSLWLFCRDEARDGLARMAPTTATRALGRLSPQDAAEVLSALGVEEPARRDEIIARAEGLPLVLDAYARATPDERLPLDLEAAMRAQIDRLSPRSRDVMKRASIFGRVFWSDGLVALGGVDAQVERESWAQPRSRARLPCGGEFEFRSALVTEAARELVGLDARRALHALAAAWLQGFAEATPEELAAHWEAAGDRGRAAEQWVVATERRGACGVAESACAAASAALSYELNARDRWRVLRSRDDALQLTGDRALQREGLDAMSALAATLGPDAESEVAWRFVHHARMVGDAALARRVSTAFTRGDGDARWVAAGLCEMAFLEADLGQIDAASRLARDAIAWATQTSDPWIEARASHALAYVEVERGVDLTDAIVRYADARERYQRAGDRRREAITLVNSAAALALLGRFGEAIDRLDPAVELARAVGNLRSVAVCLENRGAIRRAMGEFEAAEDDLSQALARAERMGHARLVEATQVERLYLAIASGAEEEVVRVRYTAVAERTPADEGAPALASQLSALLHAEERLGVRDEARFQRALAAFDRSRNPLQAAELAAAIYVARGRLRVDHARFCASIDRCLHDATGAFDRDVRRSGYERRWLVSTSPEREGSIRSRMHHDAGNSV